MAVKLTNKSGGLLVCDLNSLDGGKTIKTLRLKNNQSGTYEDKEITKHIDNLIAKGLVRKEIVKGQKSTEKSVSKEKEVK